MRLKVSSAKWRPFCLGLNVLMRTWWRHQIDTFSALLALWGVISLHKGQWRGALVFSLICAWTNGWANHRDAGDLRRHHTNYDVTLMESVSMSCHHVRSRLCFEICHITVLVGFVSYILRDGGWLSQFAMFVIFFNFSEFLEQGFPIEHHIHVGHAPLQLSCGDTCQLWMWFKAPNKYNITKSEIFLTLKLTNKI